MRLSAGLCQGVPLHKVRHLKRLARGVEDTYLAQTLEQHKSLSFYKAAPFLEPARHALVLA